MPPKMPREVQERDILFPHTGENADCPAFLSRQPYNPPSRPAQFSLQRLDLLHRHLKMRFEQSLEDVHWRLLSPYSQRIGHAVDVVEPRRDQRDLQDRRIVKSRRPQPLVVILPYLGG